MSKKFLSLVIAVFFIAVLLTYLSGDYESLANQLWNLIPPFFAAVCGVFAVRVYSMNNPHAKAIAFMALGVFFWFLGDFIWFIFEFFLNKNPFPSIADYFYLLAYPLLLLGLIVELKSNKLAWTAKKIAVGSILSLLLGIIVIYLGMIKAYNPADSALDNAIAMAYGIGDLVLIIFTMAILMVVVGYRKGKLFYPWIFILAGFLLILTADVLFAIYREQYENFLGISRNIDLGWISGFLFIAFGFFNIGNAVKEARNKLLEND